MAGLALIVTFCIVVLWLVFGRDKISLLNAIQVICGIAAIFIILLFTFHVIGLRKDNEELSVINTIISTISFFSGTFLGRYYVSRHAGREDRAVKVLGFISVLFLLFFGVAITALANKGDLNQNLSPFLFLSFILIILGLSIGSFITIIRFQVKSRITKAEQKASASDAELKLLQSQLSPHFLFNTLNNLYALSMHDTAKVPSLLLKLSDLLRYTVYETKEKAVSLSDEVNYIKNYIDFEKIRLGERLEFIANWPDTGTEAPSIAPMLLIVFVENAFKHSKNTKDSKIKISIDMQVWGHAILFNVQNSYSPGYTTATAEQHSGVGLDNVKKRLELLYPDRHELVIGQKNDTFTVKLILR